MNFYNYEKLSQCKIFESLINRPRALEKYTYSKVITYILRFLQIFTIFFFNLDVQANSIYRINGILGPQISRNPLSKELQIELKRILDKNQDNSITINLQKALELGLLNNPTLSDSYYEIEAQEWRVIANRNSWFPVIKMMSSSNKLASSSENTTNVIERTRPRNSIQMPVNISQISTNTETNLSKYSKSNLHNIDLGLNWTFFDPSRSANINASVEELKAQRFTFDVNVRNLALDIQTEYYNLQRLKQLINSLQEIVEYTTRQVLNAESKFNSGILNILDVEQIRTQEYIQLKQLIEAYKNYFDASASLAAKLALKPNALIFPGDNLTQEGAWDQSLDATIENAIRLREEIKRQLVISKRDNWLANSLINQYWPSFSIGAANKLVDGREELQFISNSKSLNVNQPNTTNGEIGGSRLPRTDIRTHKNDINNTWDRSINVSFTWDLFDGGIKRANSEALRARSRGALETAEQAKLTVIREVRESYYNYTAAAMAIRVAIEQIKSSKSATSAVQKRFDLGVADATTVIQVIIQATNTAINYSDSLAAYNQSLARLYRSSARWPSGTQELVKIKIENLKNSENKSIIQ